MLTGNHSLKHELWQDCEPLAPAGYQTEMLVARAASSWYEKVSFCWVPWQHAVPVTTHTGHYVMIDWDWEWHLMCLDHQGTLHETWIQPTGWGSLLSLEVIKIQLSEVSRMGAGMCLHLNLISQKHGVNPLLCGVNRCQYGGTYATRTHWAEICVNVLCARHVQAPKQKCLNIMYSTNFTYQLVIQQQRCSVWWINLSAVSSECEMKGGCSFFG